MNRLTQILIRPIIPLVELFSAIAYLIYEI